MNEKIKLNYRDIQDNLNIISKFSVGVSHELSNPLTAVMTLLDIVEHTAKDRLDENELENLSTIKSATGRIRQILSDIRSMGQVGVFKQDMEIELAVLLKKVINENKYITEKNDINIKIKTDSRIMVKSSPDKISRAFEELLNNSIISLTKSAENNKKILITVKKENNSPVVIIRDNGIGIKNEIISKVYEPFFSTWKSKSNIGLGLSIAFIFFYKCGCFIELDSSENEYCQFKIVFPS